MGRAGGRKNPMRPGGTDPGASSPEGHDIGESIQQDPAGSPINSQTGNILNYETVRQPVLDEPYERGQNAGWMAHGVPPEADTTEERASAMRGGPDVQRASWKPGGQEHPPPVPVPVYITQAAGGGRALTTLSTNKFTIRSTTDSLYTGATRICGRDETRLTMYVQVENAAGTVNGVNPVPATPNAGSVPATGVAQQNVNSYPVSVAIAANGATITNVSVNGITVGVAAGTYTVPAFGAISVAYTVATPTWVWSYAGPQVLGTAPTGIRIDHEESTLDVGLGALIKAGGGYQELKGCQDELFAVSADTSSVTLSIIYLYELADSA